MKFQLFDSVKLKEAITLTDGGIAQRILPVQLLKFLMMAKHTW